MPCYDGRDRTPERETGVSVEIFTMVNKRLDLVTQLLCRVCTEVEDTGSFDTIDLEEIEGLEYWWKKHKEFDKNRRQ